MGCGFVAKFYQNGQGVEQNEAKKYQFHKKACDIAPNNAIDCFNAGVAYDYGKYGFKQNKKEATRYYKLACENKKEINYEACYNLGNFYYNSEGVKQDISKAKYLYSLACNYVEAACYNLIK
ncbi:tetratricopeptide repeat protein [Campylobacter sp. 19-13652]|uniref:tetratricopeptide repeat protein n=1 Tax=Campylobacter sp. 19-13652 TaxID=2840180 RepID=UPI001C7551AE|nr:tetratricopeptide repeat protein [Campylobacter sp. 19-13652]BCX80261.1 hypothetical protein LBC_17230 [Campylobacter sp. 19-13652]